MIADTINHTYVAENTISSTEKVTRESNHLISASELYRYRNDAAKNLNLLAHNNKKKQRLRFPASREFRNRYAAVEEKQRAAEQQECLQDLKKLSR